MTLRLNVQRWLRNRPAWVTFRGIQREGWLRAFRRLRRWRQILKTGPVITADIGPHSCVEIHLLCCQRDYLCAIWALKSFYRFSGVRYPLFIHLQGSASVRMRGRLIAHFPKARLVSQAQADSLVEKWLVEQGFSRLLAARRGNPFMLKLIDFTLISESPLLMTLDADVLFFRRPLELMPPNIDTDRDGPTYFQRDPVSTYNITEEYALTALGIDLAPRVNTGITLFPKKNLRLANCEKYLSDPHVARPTGWTEQTLHALCASEQDKVAYLPDSYAISLEPTMRLEQLVARHYAGPSRPYLTEEGMSWLARTGFLGSEGRE